MQITIQKIYNGYSCCYIPHARSQAIIENNNGTMILKYSYNEPVKNSPKDMKDFSQPDINLCDIGLEQAMAEALELLKKNISGVHSDSDVEFVLS